MTVTKININQLEEYVENAFFGDNELIEYYDKSAGVNTIPEAVENVILKIQTQYPDANIFGVEIKGEKEGYFIYEGNLLISFGLNKYYRDNVMLPEFWNEIKKELGDTFQCALYSHNVRAINWLQRSGMKILFDKITILSTN